jgi:hypothetical protein
MADKPGNIPLHPFGGGGASGGGPQGGGAGSGGNVLDVPRHPMFDLREGPIDLRGSGNADSNGSAPFRFTKAYSKNVKGAKGGIVIASVNAIILGSGSTASPTLFTGDQCIYYAELKIYGSMGGTYNLLMYGASGSFVGGNFDQLNPQGPFAPSAEGREIREDFRSGPVVYRWSAEDGEVWDEIAIEAREMTFGAPGQPIFQGRVFDKTRLTLDLTVTGRAW